MKPHAVFPSTFLLIFFVSISFQTFGQGHTIRDSILSFSVWFPDQPEHSVHISETEFGEIEITRYQLKTLYEKDPNLTYIITCTRYPSEVLSGDSIELAGELLENIILNALYRDGGAVIYQDIISHRAFPGIIWRIDLPNNKHSVYGRAFAVNSKIFTLIVLTPKNRPGTQQADRFFGSFTVH